MASHYSMEGNHENVIVPENALPCSRWKGENDEL
jgi:hypothetical protein